MKSGFVAAAVLLLAACASTPKPPASSAYAAPQSPASSSTALAPNPCAPTRIHRDSDYTAGGLYAPGVSDAGPSAPIDVSGIPEPVPRDEPKARYGNRSPYAVLDKKYTVLDSADGYVERGIASWYGTKFNGRATSSGEIYDICAFTAAHKTLPLPSFARVTNLDNGRSVIVRVNDRGPFHFGRIIDLSYAAASRLGVDKAGTARVEVRAITGGQEASGLAPVVVSTPSPQTSRPIVSVPALSNGPQRVQVGSFADKNNARRLADRLEDAGIDAVGMDAIKVDGRDLWRVRVGPVAEDALPGLFGRLRDLGITGARLFSE